MIIFYLNHLILSMLQMLNIVQLMKLSQQRKNGSSENDWRTKPTFGKSWENQSLQIVDVGFVFNDIPLTIVDNFHTDFVLTNNTIGEDNLIKITSYAPNDFKSATLSLSIPEIGELNEAETNIILNLSRNYTNPNDYDITH